MWYRHATSNMKMPAALSQLTRLAEAAGGVNCEPLEAAAATSPGQVCIRFGHQQQKGQDP